MDSRASHVRGGEPSSRGPRAGGQGDPNFAAGEPAPTAAPGSPDGEPASADAPALLNPRDPQPSRTDYAVTAFDANLRAGYIDARIPHDARFEPRFVANDKDAGSNLLAIIKHYLYACDRFDFSVAFIHNGGLQALIEVLNVLRDRDVPGRFLTSTYLNFNSPDALEKLLQYPNIEVRAYQGDMHAKGYFFTRKDLGTVIVGSSNLTQAALTCNKEWNVLFHSFEGGEMLLSARREFEKLWTSDHACPVTQEWVDAYRAYKQRDEAAAQSARKPAFQMVGNGEEDVEAGAEAGAASVGAGAVPIGFGAGEDARAARAADDAGAGESPLVAANALRPADAAGAAGSAGAPTPGHRVQSASGIVPNDMQAHALEALQALHDLDEQRALLISATGTGKTYLAALEVAAQRPHRVLFIAHRKRILEASCKSFKRVLGASYSYAFLDPAHPDPQATCVFAMVSTLARRLDRLPADAFDYIIIDEAHRAGAQSYRAVMEYFQPGFYLGMTATPDRTDGYDVYSLFDHQIAYRITLKDALANDMLAPFHYFGISDLEIDDQAVDDPALFTRLVSDERVRHIIQKIEEYSVGRHRCGLIFCNRNDEARTLSAKFNERGYRTRALSGADSDDVRNQAIDQLESGALQYLFTVDIFNEGIDIPALNQIIMLRRTESPIVFIQQLGRGLRKAQGKDYTLILDFIGNYQKNYLVPLALSNDRTYNKDALRKYVKEGSTAIPGCSTITFDRVSEQRIFRAIDGGRFSDARLIRDEYAHLKGVVGRIPTLADFGENEAIDPLIIFDKYGSYHAFLSKYEPEYEVEFSAREEDVLAFVAKKLANGKRADELVLLRELIEREGIGSAANTSGATLADAGNMAADGAFSASSVADAIGTDAAGAKTAAARPAGSAASRTAVANRSRAAACETARSVRAVLGGTFASRTPRLIVCADDGTPSLDPALAEALADSEFRRQLLETIDFGLKRHAQNYAEPFDDTNLTLYGKYTYEEVCRLLSWDKNINGQNIGGYKYDRATNTFPVFINYDKAPDISDTIKYEDRFVSERELIALSKQPRTMESPEIVRLKAWPENGMRIYLFMRKNKNDVGSKEFYFLGSMHPTQDFRPITMPNTNKGAIEIRYELDVPVRDDLYEYLTSSFEEEDESE
ncbi:MAG: DEAD/DEAH box helicase [Eggerthellaceae bacterium]|jgi:superfamily II DNA or RNA helicase/HKD family nuclease